MAAQQSQPQLLPAQDSVSGSNVTKTDLQVLSLTTHKKLSPKGSQDTGLQQQRYFAQLSK